MGGPPIEHTHVHIHLNRIQHAVRGLTEARLSVGTVWGSVGTCCSCSGWGLVLNSVTHVSQQHEVVEELHRKLGMAKSEVDVAQARKEELWEKCDSFVFSRCSLLCSVVAPRLHFPFGLSFALSIKLISSTRT